MFIKELKARTIKDSRNESTIEVSVNKQVASSPAGKSTGKHETPMYHKSLSWCVSAINKLSELKTVEINSFSDLVKVESLIKKKFNLREVTQFGANALFALESAVLKALASAEKKELWEVINPRANKIPIPAGNIVGGGVHSHNENHPTFQEFLIIPRTGNAKSNFELMQSLHRKVGIILRARKKNDEGAWQANFDEAAVLSVLSSFKSVRVGVDVAASSFYCNKEYVYKNKELDRETQIHYINELIKKYNLLYVEDPLHEEDFSGLSQIKKNCRTSTLIVGDDLTATHISRLKKAVRNKSINAMIVKPNQNGSLLQVKEICDFCKENGIKIIISHRSGETMDSALADYAVAFGADYIKCGISTKWREAKLKRLIEIEKDIL